MRMIFARVSKIGIHYLTFCLNLSLAIHLLIEGLHSCNKTCPCHSGRRLTPLTYMSSSCPSSIRNHLQRTHPSPQQCHPAPSRYSHGLDARDRRLRVPEALRQVVRLVGQQDERRRPRVGVLDGDDDGHIGRERRLAAVLSHRRQTEVVVDRDLTEVRWGQMGSYGGQVRLNVGHMWSYGGHIGLCGAGHMRLDGGHVGRARWRSYGVRWGQMRSRGSYEVSMSHEIRWWSRRVIWRSLEPNGSNEVR